MVVCSEPGGVSHGKSPENTVLESYTVRNRPLKSITTFSARYYCVLPGVDMVFVMYKMVIQLLKKL